MAEHRHRAVPRVPGDVRRPLSDEPAPIADTNATTIVSSAPADLPLEAPGRAPVGRTQAGIFTGPPRPRRGGAELGCHPGRRIVRKTRDLRAAAAAALAARPSRRARVPGITTKLPAGGADRKGIGIMLLENAQDVGDLLAAIRAGLTRQRRRFYRPLQLDAV
jgi:hypothetical protein